MQDSEAKAKAKVKVSMWARITSYLPVRNQKNNISGLLSNMKSYFSDKTAKDWAFEFFFLAIELGLAAVLGVLVHAIAAMAGVGLFVSSGLTAVACALGLYCGRSMTQPMKVHIADKKQKAKRAIELQKHYNAVCMHDEGSRISVDLLRAMDIWMKDTSNLERRENVADVYKEVKALMQKQESAFSKLPEEDQKALKSEVDWFFQRQSRYYAEHLIDLWKREFPVDSIKQSLNEEGMPQGWSRFNIFLDEEERKRSENTSQDAKEQSEESKKEASSRTTKTTTGVTSSKSPVIPTTPTDVADSNIADSKPKTSTAQDDTSVLLHEGTENGQYEAEQKERKVHGNDGSLNEVQKKGRSENTSQDAAENGPYEADQKDQGRDGLSRLNELFNIFLDEEERKRSENTSQDAKEQSEESKKEASSRTTKTTTGVTSSKSPVIPTTPTDVADSNIADSKPKTSTAQDDTSVLLHEGTENGQYEAEQKERKVHGNDGSLNEVQKKGRSENTSQDAAENGPYEADQKDQGRDGFLSKVEETIQSEKTAQGDRVNGKEEAPSEATQTTTEQGGTSVLLHEDAENSLPNAKIDVKVEKESKSPPGLGFFDPQNGNSHDNEAELDADPSSAAGGLTNGDFQPTSP